MKYKKVVISSLEALLSLFSTKSCPYREFNDKGLLLELQSIKAITITGRPKIVFINSEKSIFNYLHKSNDFDFDTQEELSSYINLIKNTEVLSKDEIAEYQTTTKDSKSESFYGIHVAVLEDTVVYQKGKNIILYPLYSGSYFFFQKDIIQIPENTLVVGIENPQVLWRLHRYKNLFGDGDNIVFILINDYKNGYPFKWLSSYKGKYIHWGDYDIAGVSIYLNKVLPKLQRQDLAKFFLPHDIENSIKKLGNKSDYEKQKHLLPGLLTKASEVEREFLLFIDDCKKSLEQEKYII